MATKRRGGLLKSVLILAVLGGIGWAGARYWAGKAPSDIDFRTAAVTRGDITHSVTANGSLTPVQLVDVGSQISGVITDIKVDFNSEVKAGQVVAQIDPATYERSLAQAEAELANAQAAQELAELNYARGRELHTANLISKSEYDGLRVALSQAKAQVKTRQSNVERARVDLNRTTIHAPIDGVVITRKVEAGQTVAATMNAPTLFTIANDLRNMQIEAAVSEADVGVVEEGQKVQFMVDAFPGRRFEGDVKQVRYAPSTNQNVVTYTTVVEVDNKDLKLRPGMTATARFITAERKNVLKVPNAAVRFRPPATVSVVGDTNATTAKPALIESGPFAGLPAMPWQTGGERRRPTEEERANYVASLTKEQKQKYEKAVAELRARMSQGGGPGAGMGGAAGGFGSGAGGADGGATRGEATGPREGTVYVKAGTSGDGKLMVRAVNVKLGISDASSVEILEGLKENDEVIIGTASTATASAPRNPLGSPFGGPGGRR